MNAILDKLIKNLNAIILHNLNYMLRLKWDTKIFSILNYNIIFYLQIEKV